MLQFLLRVYFVNVLIVLMYTLCILYDCVLVFVFKNKLCLTGAVPEAESMQYSHFHSLLTASVG